MLRIKKKNPSEFRGTKASQLHEEKLDNFPGFSMAGPNAQRQQSNDRKL